MQFKNIHHVPYFSVKCTINVLEYCDNDVQNSQVEMAWRSGSVMDCYATARGSIPGGNDAKTELHVLRKEQ